VGEFPGIADLNGAGPLTSGRRRRRERPRPIALVLAAAPALVFVGCSDDADESRGPHGVGGAFALATGSGYFHAATLTRAGRPGDRDRALELLDQVIVDGVPLGMVGRVRDAQAVRAGLLGDTSAAAALARPRSTLRFRDRAKAKLIGRGRNTVAGWSRSRTDTELANRFESPAVQRGLFSALARAFQPAMAFGFEGDLVFELRPLDYDGDPRASDWWTVSILPRRLRPL